MFSLAAHYRILATSSPVVANHTRVFVGCNLAVILFAAALVFRKPDNGGSRDRGGLPHVPDAGAGDDVFLRGLPRTRLPASSDSNTAVPPISRTASCRRSLRRCWDPAAVFPIAVGIVFLWELLVPCFYFSGEPSGYALPVCIRMHWLLAPSGFLDFSSYGVGDASLP